MKKITKNLLNFMSTRLGFVLILLVLYWIKTMWAYTIDFNLDIQGLYQVFLAIINPFPISLLLLGLALYVKRTKLFYSLAFGIYLLLFAWLVSNSIYYREFSDFVTVNTMLASSSVSAGLGEAALELFRPWRGGRGGVCNTPLPYSLRNTSAWMTALSINAPALL